MIFWIYMDFLWGPPCAFLTFDQLFLGVRPYLFSCCIKYYPKTQWILLPRTGPVGGFYKGTAGSSGLGVSWGPIVATWGCGWWRLEQSPRSCLQSSSLPCLRLSSKQEVPRAPSNLHRPTGATWVSSAQDSRLLRVAHPGGTMSGVLQPWSQKLLLPQLDSSEESHCLCSPKRGRVRKAQTQVEPQKGTSVYQSLQRTHICWFHCRFILLSINAGLFLHSFFSPPTFFEFNLPFFVKCLKMAVQNNYSFFFYGMDIKVINWTLRMILAKFCNFDVTFKSYNQVQILNFMIKLLRYYFRYFSLCPDVCKILVILCNN